jgi:hypothetical protein
VIELGSFIFPMVHGHLSVVSSAFQNGRCRKAPSVTHDKTPLRRRFLQLAEHLDPDCLHCRSPFGDDDTKLLINLELWDSETEVQIDATADVTRRFSGPSLTAARPSDAGGCLLQKMSRCLISSLEPPREDSVWRVGPRFLRRRLMIQDGIVTPELPRLMTPTT